MRFLFGGLGGTSFEFLDAFLGLDDVGGADQGRAQGLVVTLVLFKSHPQAHALAVFVFLVEAVRASVDLLQQVLHGAAVLGGEHQLGEVTAAGADQPAAFAQSRVAEAERGQPVGPPVIAVSAPRVVPHRLRHLTGVQAAAGPGDDHGRSVLRPALDVEVL